MVSTKKLIQMVKKWQKLARVSRKRISWSKSAVAEKGHFVVYTTDGRRFMVPLSYLKSEILQELFRMAEEEFGVGSDCPITLPCDSSFMEYAISILERHATKEMEKALMLSLSSCHLSSSYSQQNHPTHQLIIYGF